MTFTSLTFILFYAVIFALYWGIRRRRIQNALLLVASYFFYAWWDWRFCFLMLASTLVDYLVALSISGTDKSRSRKRLLAVSVIFNLSLLGFFKYFNFFADSLVSFAGAFGWHLDAVTLQIVLPVGISFYTFQTMSYTIDVYRRHLDPTRDFIAYASYVSFFPQLVAGPIERASAFIPQFMRERRFDYPGAVDGCRQILWGFFKKMVIADNLAPIVDAAYSNPSESTSGALLLATVGFAFQIYCDFSAYSDIARGTARLLGFELMRNFAYPYFSRSIAEFWRRWHISLSTWFRDYVYIPLGGSRNGVWRTLSNIILTFTISGLWHGAAWNFIIWGVLNGLLLCIHQRLGRKRRLDTQELPGGSGWLPRLRALSSMLLTFTFVCIFWVFFRASSPAHAFAVFQSFATQLPSIDQVIAATAAGPLKSKVFPLLAAFVAVEWFQRRHEHPLAIDFFPRCLRWVIYTGIIWITIYWGTFSSGDFIYFQF